MSESNRVDEQFRKWEATHRMPRLYSEDYWEQRLGILERIKMAFKDTTDFSERESLKRVEAEIGRLIKYLKPDLFQRIERAFDRVGQWMDNLVRKAAKIKEPMVQQGPDVLLKWSPEGLSRSEREQKTEKIRKLADQLQMVGLPIRIDGSSATRILYDDDTLKLSDRVRLNGQPAKVEAQISRAEGSGQYYPTGYDLITYRGLQAERDQVAGVDIRDLEKRMQAIPWEVDFSRGAATADKNPAENTRILQAVNTVFVDLNRLLAAEDAAARKIHDQLVVGFFLDTPNSVLVSKIDDIKKQFEHKVHVDLSPGSVYALRPEEAMQLLNRRSVNLASDNGRGQAWIEADFTQKDVNGYYRIRPLEGSERFVLQAALAASNVVRFPDFRNDKEAMRALYRGESVKAELLQNGQQVQRYLHAEPERGRLAIDWIRSEREGLFQRDERLVANLEQYVGRQHGISAGPVSSSVEEKPTMISATGQQPLLWEVEASQKERINPVNLAKLNDQLLDLGVEPGITKEMAREVLELSSTTGQKDVQKRYIQEYDGNWADATIRFKSDPDLGWVSLQGFDMKVSFADGGPEVHQRYYHNAENPAQNYSLAEAFWMASGNGVSRIEQVGTSKQERWYGLGLDQPKTPQGNHQITSFEFDLDKGLSEYPRKNELERRLAPGYTMEGILARARKGESVQFPINRDGSTELLTFQVQPGGIKIFNSGDQLREKKASQEPVVNTEKVLSLDGAGQKPNRSNGRGQ